MWLVMRAPFLPIGSLAIWTRISWPSLSRSLILGTSCVSRRWKRRPPRRPRGLLRSNRRTRRALRVAGGRCRSANFYSRIDGAVAASFGIEQRLSFGLRFFEFDFFANLLRLRRAPRRELSVGRPRRRTTCESRKPLHGRRRSNAPVRLACRASLFFELVVAFVGRFLVMNVSASSSSMVSSSMVPGAAKTGLFDFFVRLRCMFASRCFARSDDPCSASSMPFTPLPLSQSRATS